MWSGVLTNEVHTAGARTLGTHSGFRAARDPFELWSKLLKGGYYTTLRDIKGDARGSDHASCRI